MNELQFKGNQFIAQLLSIVIYSVLGTEELG